MRGKRTVGCTRDEAPEGRTDWARVDALTDAEIDEAIRADPDAAPTLDEDWFRNAELVGPEGKEQVSLRLDRDVVAWFRRQGRGYQTRMNAVLRAYVEAQKRKAG